MLYSRRKFSLLQATSDQVPSLHPVRIRPNEQLQSAAATGKPSDLHRRFQKAFDAVVAVENPAVARHEFRDWYVSVPYIESALNESTTGEIDSLRFFLGSTGIGKSTMLRYVFQAAQEPIIRDDYLLVPFCFNSRQTTIDVFNPVARAASRHLSETLSIPFDSKELYASVKRYRPDLLELDRTLPESATDEQRLQAFQRHEETHYELEKLKWFLTHSPLKRVILVIDDVESLEFDAVEQLILDICKAYAHLQNQIPRKFSVKCIISCRPSTYALLRKKHWYGVYSFDEPLSIQTAVGLQELFTARFRSALKKLDLASRKDEWERAYGVLMKIVSHVSDKYEIRLTHLCNNNVREALREFKQLLMNRRWFQRNKVVTPSFTLQEGDFAVNEAAVYRALALRDGDVYPARDTVIVNLLHNTSDERSDLLVTYVIRYLLNHKNAGDEPGDSQVAKAILCNDLANLFPDITGSALIDDCIDYMVGASLLETDHVQGEDILILTLRAQALWGMLQTNSICLAFFRDDTYQLEAPLLPLSPVDHQYSEHTFADVIAFVSQIANSERIRVQNAIKYNLLPDYVARFGEKTLSRHLIGGVGPSLNRFYFKHGGPPESIKGLLRLLDNDVRDLEIIIGRSIGNNG
jgi:hypothetical protein